VISIQKLDYLKSYETEFKNQFAVDKKYLPISKKLVVILRDINPFLDNILSKEEKAKEISIKNNLNINRAYGENIENYHRSLALIVEKNHSEVDKFQKQKLQKTHDLNINFKTSLELLEQKISQIQEETKEKLNKSEQTLKRELGQIQKVMVEARKVHQQATTQIEKEKERAEKLLAQNYDKKIAVLDQQLIDYENELNKKLVIVKEDSQVASSLNDESYLTIKNTYSQLSVSLNKKINEIKKKHQVALTQLDKENQAKIKPIHQSIEDLKKSYQEAQRKSLEIYGDKLTSLNVIFDVQKKNFDDKKARIIHEGNDAITLLNSKLSAFRETIQKEKLMKSREMRDEMKSIEEERDREKKNHDLTSELKAFDSELNKQIIRTNKDIVLKKKEIQKRLYDLDIKHLREINDWRLKKVLYEYEKKQDFAKIDLNYNHNISASEQLLKVEELHFQYKKEVLLLEQNKNLLPLEYQLAIAASIQERELNLLANDAHLSIASFKHSEQLLEFEFKKNQALIHLERERAKALFNADSQVLKTNTQLELEKEKIKRDFTLSEEELRIELNQAIYNKSKQAIEHDYNIESFTIESEREKIYIENKYTLDLIKEEALLEEQKRAFVISEAKYKHQLRFSNEKASRLLKIYQNELELNQNLSEQFMDIVRMLYQNDLSYLNIVKELYHLPSHPEVFKGVLKSIISLTKEISTSLTHVLNHYQLMDQDFYVKKIDDLTGYKFMLKHEDLMNFYETEIDKAKEKKIVIEKDIRNLEEQFFQNTSELERHHAALISLEKVTYEIKSSEKGEHKHHDIKENQKVVANHEQESKRIRLQLQKIEKSIDEKHALIDPIDKEILKIEVMQKESEKKLDKEKHQEASSFYRFLNKNQDIYQRFGLFIQKHYQSIILFYEALSNEVYVSDLFLTTELKKLEKSFSLYEKETGLHQQRFLNLMLNFYLKNQKEQALITRGFKQSTQSLLKSLNENYNATVETNRYTHEKRQNDKVRSIKIENGKLLKRLEIEGLSYKKKLMLDLSVLKSLEVKITENGQKRDQELKLINDNQQSIAQQYQQDHLVKSNQLLEQYNKTIAQLDLSIQNSVKNHIGLEESLDNKNQAILSKYQANYEKNLASLKQKTNHYLELIQKETDLDIEKRKTYEENIKRMNQKRENELKNINSHLQRFNQTTTKTQDRTLKKELRVLKKAHYSRVRMLHLN
jgi:golgin subfamily A member 4